MAGKTFDISLVLRALNKLLAMAITCLWLGAGPVCAENDFVVRGFGTVGMARTTTDDVEFVRDLSQARGIDSNWSAAIDSVFGLQANWQLNPELEVVAQGISRYNNQRNFKPDLAWAYVKYDPTPALSLRAGRLGTEFFMQADSRWVGYSFLTVRPIGDYFWYLPFYSIHGADAALTQSFGDAVVRGKVFYGHSTGQIPLASQQWDINDSPMLGSYLELQHGAWHVRGSYANIRFTQDLPLFGIRPAEANFLSTKGQRTHYYSLGAIYEPGPWQLQLMLNHIKQGSKALESSNGGYALLGYRIGRLTPYLGYSWIRSKPRTESLDVVTSFVMSDSHSDQRTRILGARWDVAKDMALKIQWDGIRGDASSLFPYRMDNRARWDGGMDVFSATLDFIF